MGKSWIIICTIITIFFAVPMVVQAHAYLDQSSPTQESELDESPSEIRLQFSEPIDTMVSQARLENEAGQQVEVELAGEGDDILILSIPELDEGIYNVYWQVLSLDTHITDGSFRFSVGEELPQAIPEETVAIGGGAQESALAPSEERDGVLTFVRVVENLLFVLVASWFVFARFLWRKKKEEMLSLQLERVLYFSAFLLFSLTGAANVFWRAIQFLGESETNHIMWQAAESIGMSSMVGWMAVLRPAVFLLLFVITFVRAPTWIKAGGLLTVLASFTFMSHATSISELVSHFVHMLAAVIWIGGLVGFTYQSMTIPKKADSLNYFHNCIRMFSKIALLSVLVLMGSGLWLSYRLLGSIERLTASLYGEALIWKVGFFLVAIVVAAFHRFVWLPNLQKLESLKEKRVQITALVWGLRIELLLVVASLVFAGILSTTSPPVEAEHDHGSETEEHGH